MSLFIAIILIASLLGLYKLLCNGSSSSPDIPGPRTLPFFGNSLEISKKRNFTLYLNENVEKYGSVFKFFVGSQMYTVLTDPEDVEILLRDTVNIKKSPTYNYVKPFLGEGLLIASGNHWHKHRKLLTPAFHFGIVEKFLAVFLEKAKTLIEVLEPEAKTGDVFDVSKYISAFAKDAFMETSLGQNINTQKAGKTCDYINAMNRLQSLFNIRAFSRLLRNTAIFNLTEYGREHNEKIDLVNDYCLNVIKQRKEAIKFNEINDETDDVGMKKKAAFLDVLLVEQETGNGLTDANVLDEIKTFLFAGYDPSSTAVTFALYSLGIYQDVQQKLYEEITALYGDSLQELSMRVEMLLTLPHELQCTKYLDMVIKESLRIFPPVTTFSRTIQQDLHLSKYVIPAGTSVYVYCHGLHRNKEHFPEPEKFDPERFSTENSKNRHPYAFVPFSAGPRNCIGQKYAMVEMKIALIKIMQKYKILPDHAGIPANLTALDRVKLRIGLRK